MGDTRIPLGGGGGQAGGREGSGGGRRPRWGRVHVSKGGRYGHPPCSVGSGWRDVLHPCARHDWVEALGLHPCAHQHRVEGTVGVTPLLPTPAPLPIVGLWEWCNSCTRAAAHAFPPVHPVCWCCSGVVAALRLPSPRYHRGAMGVHRPHSSCSARTAPVAAHVAQQFWHCTRTIAKLGPLCTRAQGGEIGSPSLCTIAQSGGIGSLPLCTTAQGGGIGAPPLCTTA